MITDMLKTENVVSGSVGKGSVRQNEAVGSAEDFSAVLTQVTGLDKKGDDSKRHEKTVKNQKTVENKNTEHTPSSHEQRASRAFAEKAQIYRKERDAVGAAVSGKVIVETGHRTRLVRLSEKLAGMNIRQRVDGDRAALGINAAKAQDGRTVEKKNGKTVIKRELHQALLLKGLRKRGAVRVSVIDTPGKDARPATMQAAEEKTSLVSVKSKKSTPSLKLQAPRFMNLQEEPLKSNEPGVYMSLKNDRDTADRSMRPGSERLPEALLSRYEDSVKSVEIKSNYQNSKIADGNFEEIVRQFTLLVREGGGEAKLLLQPEHLGSLKLRIQLDRGEVATSIIVDNQAVKDLIMSRLNILEESLLEHGFDLGSFEVGVKGENAGEEAATETAKGNMNAGTVVETTGVEEEMLPENASWQLPWMSTRVNITV